MKPSWIALILGVSISCLAASYFLLPRVVIGEQTSAISTQQQRLDTLALPNFSGASFERLTLKREVNPGDTLGYVFRDKYVVARDALTAFAKTSILPLDFGNLPRRHVKELKGMLQSRLTTSTARTKNRYVLRGIEREYLASEIMGAEDAATEMMGRLSHLADAGKSESPAHKALEAQFRQKQTFISTAKRRMAQKEVVNVASKQKSSKTTPTLTAAQKSRILTLSNQLPVDTIRVIAPITGRYYRPDSGVGYIISKSLSNSLGTLPRDDSRPGYTLKSEGHPALWGTAQRSDSSSQSETIQGKELKVSIQ